ncbi:putative Signal peptidase I [Clostridium bornimense]|uniref:Signal peptidase I n=1 Tax=Clostridium bornimense TaxID=1216932 RepID=W6S089_9CLOT|nr:signal peptidase I [Clostridium bornimense]CDM70148.1 putative Signal peptidase I [Clostridium bornimense]
MKKELIKSIKEWGFIVLIALVISIIISQFVQVVTVSGQSMKNTLNDSDKLVMSKIAYKNHKPKYKDIVIIQRKDKLIVKRVIGEPGDKVEIIDNKVYINGNELIENYINEDDKMNNCPEIKVTLNDDEIFVMGDNRNHSLDSRDSRVGVINYKKDVVGKIVFRVFPMSHLDV